MDGGEGWGGVGKELVRAFSCSCVTDEDLCGRNVLYTYLTGIEIVAMCKLNVTLYHSMNLHDITVDVVRVCCLVLAVWVVHNCPQTLLSGRLGGIC